MTRKPDIQNSEIPVTARTRVRLPDAYTPSRVFHGWGPDLGR